MRKRAPWAEPINAPIVGDLEGIVFDGTPGEKPYAHRANTILLPGDKPMGNPEVIGLSVGSVPTNALVVTETINSRIVGHPETIAVGGV